MNMDLLKQLLLIAVILSVITMSFIQKTKGMFKTSKFIGLYSAIVNFGFAVVFCLTFTDIVIANSLWVGLFSFIGADTIYKSLEGKLKTYSEIVNDKSINTSKENIIELGDE